MLLGTFFGDEDVEACLVETHNLSVSQGAREIARYFELADEVRGYLSGRLSQCLRIGVTRLASEGLFDDRVVNLLRDEGFDVEVFVPELVVNG
jgi:hypothetical protein